MSSQKESKKERQKKIIIVIAFVVILIALAVCLVLLFYKPKSGLDRGFVKEGNRDDIMSEMTDKVEEGMFECKMTTTWTFENADSVSPNAYVANVENNRYTFYFDVYEESTNELLYSSPLLPVGTEINDIKLEKKLSAGDYNAVVMYTLVDENEEEVSTAGFTITISVVH